MKNISIKTYFRSIKNFDQKNFDQKFSDFFRRKKIRPEIFGLPIPIPISPKIPKITLRTACDHFKNTNNRWAARTLCAPRLHLSAGLEEIRAHAAPGATIGGHRWSRPEFWEWGRSEGIDPGWGLGEESQGQDVYHLRMRRQMIWWISRRNLFFKT